MSQKPFDVCYGVDSQSDQCVAVFGHVRPSFAKSLTAVHAKSVFALKSRFRINHTITILESVELRLEFARSISKRSKSLLIDFLDSDFCKPFLQISDSDMDHGLHSSRGFLDSIDRHEVKLLSLLISAEALLGLPSLPKYAIYPHDPHGLSDISFYYVLRFLGINVYSYRCISETPYSLVFCNIFDRLPSPMSIASLDCLVENRSPVPGASQIWFESISKAVKVGAWSDVDAMVKHCSVKPFAPPTGKFDFNPLDSLKGPFRKLSKKYLIPALKLISLFSFNKLQASIREELKRKYSNSIKWLSRNFNLLAFSYSNTCISSDFCFRSIHDVPNRFVYLPLHIQPESTTSSFGLDYENQLLFLRKVRALLAPDISIVIKDHPCAYNASLSYARPNNYFQYISSMIPGVKFAPLDLLSKDLITGALCTFTVNGTACLESSFMGKPAVFGGLSIFSSLPNMSHIDSFKSPDDFAMWLFASSSITTNDSGFKKFFSIREPFMHNCVLYGAIESTFGVSESYESLERHHLCKI